MVNNVLEPISASITLLGLAIPEQFKKWQEEKVQNLRTVIEAEIKLGDLNAAQQDKFYSALIRFNRACLEGASRNKLRLMAQILNNTLDEPELDRRVYLESILADMTDSEIFLISVFYNISKNRNEAQKEYDKTLASGSKEGNTPKFLTRKMLVPKIYATNEALDAAMARLVRTGLLIPASAWDGLNYEISPLMDELVKLCDIQAYNNPMSSI